MNFNIKAFQFLIKLKKAIN